MNDTVLKIKENKIIAIARNVPSQKILFVVDALLRGGVSLLEVTFNQSEPKLWEDTAAAIALVKTSRKEACVGAGTVIRPEQLNMAKEAGAEFILSPNVDYEIIRETKKNGLVSIPGALTPSECVGAFFEGADFIKLFPAGEMGESYLKAVLSPLNNIPFICVGGINENNIPSFLKVGAEGFGIGGNLINEKLVLCGDYAEIERRARVFSSLIKSID